MAPSKRVPSAAEKAAEPKDIIFTFPLRKPINAYGEEITVLELRRPTGADLVRVGNPVKFTPHAEPPIIEHDYVRVAAMVARLANVPSSSIERLEPDELTALAWGISPFFLPAR